MLDDTSNPNVSSEMDALLKRRVLEQLGVTIHSNDSSEAVEYQHAISLDLMSEEMSGELGSPTEVRMALGEESYILWMKIDSLPASCCVFHSQSCRKKISRRCFVTALLWRY